MIDRTRSLGLLLLMCATLAGCGSKELAPVAKVYWPPPPGEPKMEWITTYESEKSFRKTKREIAAEKFLGEVNYQPFLKPMGVASAGDGVVFVADIDAGSVQAIDFNNRTADSYLEELPVSSPAGMEVDSQGGLFVVDVNKKRIVRFGPDRKLLMAYGETDLMKPTSIALDEARGRVYVSDVRKHEIFAYDLESGAKLFSFGGAGDVETRLFGPQGIDVDDQGRIFVAEQLNARIQVFDSEGQSLYTFAKRGDRDFELEAPRGLALDSENNVYVSDVRRAVVWFFREDGEPLGYLGGRPTGHALGFGMPNDIYIDAKDRIYITDGLNRRVTIWQRLTKDYLSKHPLDSEALFNIEKRLQRLRDKKE